MKYILSAGFCISLAIFSSDQLRAQTTEISTETPEGQDIIVTATKRAESIQEVPLSLKALGQEQLENLGADSLQSFAGQTPGLVLTGTRASTQLVIRGVTTGPVNHDQAEIKETVSLYLDETPISVQRFSPNLKLYDVKRVEVLRGPQGTLYGAGSMAGAIRLITNKPDTTRFGASAKAQLLTMSHGNAGGSADAMLNVPLAQDRLALRVVGSWRREPGFIDNVITGRSNVNSENVAAGRLQLRYIPSTATTIDGLVSYQRSNLHANDLYAEEAGYLKTSVTANEPYRDRTLISYLSVNQEFGSFDATGTGSYLRKNLSYSIESEGLIGFIAPGASLSGLLDNQARQNAYVGEIRITSKPASIVSWTIGAFYQKTDNDYFQNFIVPGVDQASGIPSSLFGASPDNLYSSQIYLKERQIAVFGEIGVPVLDDLIFSVGGRYFDARQSSDITFAGIFADPNIGQNRAKAKEHGFNPRFNLSYQATPDALFYIQAAKGFRLGGTNEPIPLPACQQDLLDRGLTQAPENYASDSLWNYEAGAKTTWIDRKLTINVAAYKIRWKNPQVTSQLGCGFNVFVNAGGLDIKGAELDVTARPLRGLTFTGGLSYNDSILRGDLAFVSGRDGDHAPYVPRWTFNGSLNYEYSASETLTGTAFIAYHHQRSRNTRFNTTLPSNFRLASYGVVTARVGLENDRWSASIFAENLFDRRGQVDKRSNPFTLTPATFITPVTPRIIGLELSVNY